MIAEGEERFTIRDLASRADVSATTIYTAFGDKKGLIAAAIEDYFEDLPMAQAIPKTSLADLVAFQDESQGAILANRAYARKYAELYFSRNLDDRIHRAIQGTAIGSGGCLPWLQKAMRDGDMLPGVKLEYIVTLLASQRLLVLHDWARGRMSDDDMTVTKKLVLLILARGVTQGRTQARVAGELTKLLRSATLKQSTG
jgi:AcrR family transcriptional regulator